MHRLLLGPQAGNCNIFTSGHYLTHMFVPWASLYRANGQNTKWAENPSDSFRDMQWANVQAHMGQIASANKPIWVKWANNHDVAQLQFETLQYDFEKRTSVQQCRRCALAHGQAHMDQIGKGPYRCTTTGLDIAVELRTLEIRPAFTELYILQSLDPAITDWHFLPMGKSIWGKWANDHAVARLQV